LNDRNPWKTDDWLDHPFWDWMGRVFKFLWPFIAIIGGLFLLRLAWGLGPLVFGIIVIGAAYFIMRFRWAVHDSWG